jgi:uncharacterized protein YjhX (UPF0386 family)
MKEQRRYVDAKGRVRVVTGYGVGGWEYEHRLVMERHLGRRLTRREAVHHRDGNPANNDLANLELMSVGEHVALHNRSKPKRRKSAIDSAIVTSLK